MVRGDAETARAVIGRYEDKAPPNEAWSAPELRNRLIHDVNKYNLTQLLFICNSCLYSIYLLSDKYGCLVIRCTNMGSMFVGRYSNAVDPF